MGLLDDRDRAQAAWRLAESQHFVVNGAQLRELGFSKSAISYRVKKGRLRRIHPAVYAVGPSKLTCEGCWTAALLYAGPDSALSHSSSGELWGIADEWAVTEVTVAGERRLRSPGVRAHRTKSLPPGDLTVHAGFRTTTVARTLIDLAARHSTKRLESAVNAAVRRRHLTLEELREAVALRPGVKGVRHLRRLLDARTFRLTDSALEQRFLPIAAAAGLPVPQTRVMLNGFRVDFHWPDLGLVVETDGLSYHWTPQQQQRDRARDHAHSEAGLHPLRFTHEQVTRDPDSVARTLREVAANLASIRMGPKAA